MGVILVYDAGNRESLDALSDWMQSVKYNLSWQWENVITFVLWGNDRDQSLNPVSIEDLDNFILGNNMKEDLCYSVNAFAGKNIFESYHSLLEMVHHHLSQRKREMDKELSTSTVTAEPVHSEEKSSCC